MDFDLRLFFNKMPQSLPLYEMFKEKVCKECTDVEIKIQKSQIAFSNKHNFAFVWLPIHKMKSRPEIYIIVSFCLTHKLESQRIVQVVEPYPDRWMHHVIIQDRNEIDIELMSWIKEAYEFANNK